jgi:hypothetical protein
MRICNLTKFVRCVHDDVENDFTKVIDDDILLMGAGLFAISSQSGHLKSGRYNELFSVLVHPGTLLLVIENCRHF